MYLSTNGTIKRKKARWLISLSVKQQAKLLCLGCRWRRRHVSLSRTLYLLSSGKVRKRHYCCWVCTIRNIPLLCLSHKCRHSTSASPTRVSNSPFCNSAVGAGDTFIAGALYKLVTSDSHDDNLARSLQFAVNLATMKVQREGFGGLGSDVSKLSAWHGCKLGLKEYFQ